MSTSAIELTQKYNANVMLYQQGRINRDEFAERVHELNREAEQNNLNLVFSTNTETTNQGNDLTDEESEDSFWEESEEDSEEEDTDDDEDEIDDSDSEEDDDESDDDDDVDMIEDD